MLFFFGYANACIYYANGDFLGGGPSADVDGTVFLGEFEAVGDEVVDDSADLVVVEFGFRDEGVDVCCEVDGFAFGECAAAFDGFFYGFFYVVGGFLDGEESGVEFGRVKNHGDFV